MVLGSGCTNDYKITHSFLNVFNYSSASLAGWNNGINENGGFNPQTIKSNLNYNMPVIIGGFDSYINILGAKFASGSGHTWVCDGYMSTQYTTYGTLLFHMNWGYKDESLNHYNGWYAV